MAVYTRLSEEEFKSITDAYGLGEFLAATEIAQGVENSNYFFDTKKKSKKKRSILTIYEQRVDTDKLPFYLGMMEHLHGKGIPCPLPLKTKDSQQFIGIRDKKAAIVTFLEGQSVRRIGNAHIREVGGWLARMHLAAEGFTLRRENGLSVAGWHKLIGKIGAQADEIASDLSRMLTDEFVWLAERWPTHLPEGVIHADLFPDNVFFKGDSLSGVIDFYFACNDLFLYELAIVLNAWCFEQGTEFNITKAGILLNAYHTVRPIGPQELEALPILCRGAALRFLLTRAHDLIFPQTGALVIPHDPMEYYRKLQFHQQVRHHGEYGL